MILRVFGHATQPMVEPRPEMILGSRFLRCSLALQTWYCFVSSCCTCLSIHQTLSYSYSCNHVITMQNSSSQLRTFEVALNLRKLCLVNPMRAWAAQLSSLAWLWDGFLVQSGKHIIYYHYYAKFEFLMRHRHQHHHQQHSSSIISIIIIISQGHLRTLWYYRKQDWCAWCTLDLTNFHDDWTPCFTWNLQSSCDAFLSTSMLWIKFCAWIPQTVSRKLLP